LNPELDGQTRARVGDVLNDKWTLERLLGVGGMGAVYAGRHRNGARAAVKVLHRYLSQHPDVRARFLREGYAANRVEKPGVVKVLDDDIVVGGPDDGTAYLVMELLDGESLEDRVLGGWKLTERNFLAIADSVLEVLEAAHANGVVHRDIKPENIFIAKDESGVERIKVLDFGLARLLEGHSTTTHGLALGTPSFMSPEQAAAKNAEIDGRTDLFALAASGFRLITGRRIHEGSGPIDMISKMANLPAPRIRTVAPTVSESFARVIDRALEFHREDRYENAAAMRLDVQAAMATLDSTARRGAPPIAAASEPSIELSAADFEHTQPPKTVADPRGKPTLADAPQARPSGLGAHPTQLGIQPTQLAPQPSQPAPLPPPPTPVASQPTPFAMLPTEPAGHAVPSTPHAAEESLSAVPMQRGYLVPVAVGLTVLGIGAVVYATLGGGAPAPQASLPGDAGVVTSDASSADVATIDASPDVAAVVDATSTNNPPKEPVAPKRRSPPSKSPVKPGKKHPKH
jgi:serine/threonine protein kinase